MRRRRFLKLGAAAPLIPLVGCGGGDGGTGPTPPGPPQLPTGQDLTNLTPLGNTSGTPRLFTATLTAAPTQVQFVPGTNTDVWAYNGLVPGPLVDVTEGDTVRILFVNGLAQDSSIHWHGLPVPPSQDGLPMDAIPPGTSRYYQFTLPQGSAGTYWYHPHPHMNSAEQVFRGLAGVFIVRDPRNQVPAGIEEKTLFISDLRLDDRGAIPANSDNDRIDGREGNHLLVNGRELPRITIRPGTSQRWRIINGTNARYLRLALTNHTMVLIGTDGGLFRTPVPFGEILLAPAERIEVVVTGTQPGGTTATLFALPYDRRKLANPTGPSAQVAVASLAYTMDAGAGTPLPSTLRTVARLPPPSAKKQVVFQVQGDGASRQFLVNGKVFDLNRVDLRSGVNTVEEWDVTNLAGMDHPFHIHQGQFQIVSRTKDGVTRAESLLAWKDTFTITPTETVRFRMTFPRRGLSVFHCHILEHEAHGMMGVHEIV